MNHERMRNTTYNVLGTVHTTHAFLIWYVWMRASVIASLSHPGLTLLVISEKSRHEKICKCRRIQRNFALFI